MYENGIAVARDSIAAEALYLLAAQNGSVQGGLNLSAVFSDRGDSVRSLAWCLWAQNRDSSQACGDDVSVLPQARALANQLTP